MAIIEVNNLGKQYFIGERQPYLALRDVLVNVAKNPMRWFFGKSGVNGSGSDNIFWALKNLNFTVEPGEVMGIIGRNGAGKSTLLKILSQITPPTTGTIRLKGRVGSLLEVGTGFHPELTGRENIFLNGSILGMRKKEIERKFDEIVNFAGIEKFLDTPVKRYSSGMYVRLAFAVAAHLEPDILVVDEVLAVGDAEFQKKSLGKMKEVTQEAGRTVLFVSHNMGAIRSLCDRCILLDGGELKAIGPTDQVVDQYLAINNTDAVVEVDERHHIKGNGHAHIQRVALCGNDSKDFKTNLSIGEPIKLVVDYTVKVPNQDLSFWVIFSDRDGKNIVSSFQKDTGIIKNVATGDHQLEISFSDLGLLPGKYAISFGVFNHLGSGVEFSDWVDNCLMFDVDNFFVNGQVFDQRLGMVNKQATWNNIF